MNRHNRLLAAIGLTVSLLADAKAQTDPGLLAVGELGSLNGQALACQELQAAQRAKRLMLAHAPKTQRFGTAFEESTNKSFLAQTGGTKVCPNASELSKQLDAIALQLQTHLPAAPAASPAVAPQGSK